MQSSSLFCRPLGIASCAGFWMNIRFHKTPRDRIELLLVISGLLLLAAVLRFEVSGDGAIRYRMLQMFVDEHRVAAEQYSLVHPITSIPLYIMGKIAGQPQRVVERFNLFIFCGMLLVIYRRLSSWTDSQLLCRWFLVMLTCSMFLHHLRMFYTEVFSTAGIVVGLVSIVTNAPIAGALTIS